MTLKKHICIFAAVIGLLSILLYYSNNMLGISNYTIPSSKIPKEFDGFRILQISDFHNALPLTGKVIQRSIESDPDIIVITGDLIDANHTDVETAISLCEELTNIAPVYFVSGNHEAWMDGYTELADALQKIIVQILNNGTVDIVRGKGTVKLTGIKDHAIDNVPIESVDPAAAIMYELNQVDINEDYFNVLLSHRAEGMESYVFKGYDLVFSGHAHGGQFIIPFIGGLIAPDQGLFPKYFAGEYRKENTIMIVSRGIGNSIIPVRVNNPPELVLVSLNCPS